VGLARLLLAKALRLFGLVSSSVLVVRSHQVSEAKCGLKNEGVYRIERSFATGDEGITKKMHSDTDTKR